MALKKHALKSTVATLTLMAVLAMGLPANAQLGDQLLKRGMRDADVKVLQQHLKDLGHMNYNGTTTYYGYITENAVRDFQRANGLKVDGYFGPNTSKALNNKINKTNSSSNSTNTNTSLFNYTRVLKYGSRGQDVKSLQSILKSLGHYSSSIDGIFGSGTRSAVRNFQRSQRISVDGYFGPNSYKYLKNTLSGNTSPSNPAPDQKPSNNTGLLTYKRVLKYGSRGQDVKSLQSALDKLNYYSSGIDGIYGSGTRSAVRNFQRAAHIAVDGYAGPNTIKTINKALNGELPNRGGSTGSNTNNSSRDKLTQNIINESKKYLGVPYRYAGSTPSGFDCSGYTQYVYRKLGISLSRSSVGQANNGSRVSRNNLKPGDLVIFEGTYKPGPSHTGIYLGNDMFISATSSKGIAIASLNSNYWGSHYAYGRRVY
ncbi:peptidoglycan-binding protein [Senegalia massiliensis]|uniref:Peptidase n=1 Tax=Senegalia massiliensis TaxID=1720316 RepID=A0A845R085_9CLOT|nr:peptidoglycan-binding protein [Senegalia massiliensis]NBI06003.1 peptidase [Senegalia massiliensis]